jgi:predicted PurR-regulated permease PerM
MKNHQTFILDISWTSIFKIAVALFVLYLLYLTGSLLILALFALIISLLFSPLIDFFERKKIPRGISVVFIYGGAFGILGLLIYFSLPVFVSETQKFLDIFPVYFERFATPFRILGFEAFATLENFTKTFQESLVAASANILSAIFAIFGGIFSTIFVITTGIFLSLERKPIESALSLLSPSKYQEQILEIWARAKSKVAGWFLARLLASLFVGVACWVSFVILGLEFPVSLAIIGGLLNFIPIVGPILAGIIIFVFSVLEDLMIAIFAVLAFTLIQQIENNILTPLLTKRFVGLSPVLVLLAFAIGAKLWGILGAILTIPLFAVILEFIRDFMKIKKGEVLSQAVKVNL